MERRKEGRIDQEDDMEGSRMRTFLGAGLVLLGGLLLLRALASPVAFVAAPMPAVSEVEELTREQQRAQSEIERAQIEIERAKLEIQRELELAKREAQANADVELPPLPPMPALPAMPPLPPMPPTPPAAPLFHIGAWLNPPLVLVALLALLLWRRGRRNSTPQQA
jgi:hypothetical protein